MSDDTFPESARAPEPSPKPKAQAPEVPTVCLHLEEAADKMRHFIARTGNQGAIHNAITDLCVTYNDTLSHRWTANTAQENMRVFRATVLAFAYQLVIELERPEAGLIAIRSWCSNDDSTPDKRVMVFWESRRTVKRVVPKIRTRKATKTKPAIVGEPAGYRMVEVDELLQPILEVIKAGRASH
jgi:hypothetical protein